MVWMPTNDAENQVRCAKENRPFVAVSRNGELLPEVKEVLGIIARHRLVLATGHSSAGEDLVLIRTARSVGVESIVVTHPMSPPVNMSIKEMKQAAAQGAYLEFTYSGLLGPGERLDLGHYVTAIRAVGPEHCILSSDLGQPGNPLHPDGLMTFFQELRARGFTQQEIDQMSKVNPAKLLNLP
jgi:predicted metal-dependent phosphotriesterase family hydrolase